MKIQTSHVGYGIIPFDGFLFLMAGYGLCLWFPDFVHLRQMVHDPHGLVNSMLLVGALLFAMVLLTSIGTIWGVALVRKQTWASGPAGLLLAALHLPGFPIGTALGLWYYIAVILEKVRR